MSVVLRLLKQHGLISCIGTKDDSPFYIWSDGEDHDEDINLSCLRMSHRQYNRAWKRNADKFNGHLYSYVPGDDPYLKGQIVMAFDYVEYAQGTFFNHRYFHRKNWLNVCNTKRGMIDFFDRYIDRSDETARDVVRRFTDAWKDGMIFICTW